MAVSEVCGRISSAASHKKTGPWALRTAIDASGARPHLLATGTIRKRSGGRPMDNALTAEKVSAIVGDLGAERLLEIIDTGATEQELLEAKVLALQGELPRTPREGVRTPVVHAVYDILRADMPDPREG
jgi:hypothetical protein